MLANYLEGFCLTFIVFGGICLLLALLSAAIGLVSINENGARRSVFGFLLFCAIWSIGFLGGLPELRGMSMKSRRSKWLDWTARIRK